MAKLTIKGETPLERAVARWLNEQGRVRDDGPEGAYGELMQGGCSSGIVGDLIYYRDTCRFFKRHKAEISALLKEALENVDGTPGDVFGDKWDKEDPLAQGDLNQNLLAWFGFEETARALAQKYGIGD